MISMMGGGGIQEFKRWPFWFQKQVWLWFFLLWGMLSYERWVVRGNLWMVVGHICGNTPNDFWTWSISNWMRKTQHTSSNYNVIVRAKWRTCLLVHCPFIGPKPIPKHWKVPLHMHFIFVNNMKTWPYIEAIGKQLMQLFM